MFSGLPDPEFHVTDSQQVKLITERVKAMLENLTTSVCDTCTQIAQQPGYCGVSVLIGDYPKRMFPPMYHSNFVNVHAYNGTIQLVRNPFDSRVWYFSDPGREFERMIINSCIRNNLQSQNQNKIFFKDVIPEELKQPVIRSGFISFEQLSDFSSIIVDFSTVTSGKTVLATPHSKR